MMFASLISAPIKGDLAWTGAALPNIGSGNWKSIIFNGTQYVVLGYNGTTNRIATSTSNNGTGFTASNVTIAGQPDFLAYNGTTYLTMRTDGVTATSTDLITWTAQTGVATGTIESLKAIGNTFFVYSAVSPKRIYTSTDGISWATYIRVSGDYTRDIIYNGSFYFSIDGSNQVVRSSDLINWSVFNTGITGAVYAIMNVDSKIYIGSYSPPNGYIFTSINDGASWTDLSANFFNFAPDSLMFSKGVFYATGFDGVPGNPTKLASSIDAITWDVQSISPTYEFYRNTFASPNFEFYLQAVNYTSFVGIATNTGIGTAGSYRITGAVT
jgi:hypothetical protein